MPRWFLESFMVISSVVCSEIWARVHTSRSSNTQFQVHGEKYISRTRFFSDMRFSQDVSRYFVLSISAIKSAYSMVRFSANVKNLIFWHIFVIFGWFRIFDQKRALSVSLYYRYLTSCKKNLNDLMTGFWEKVVSPKSRNYNDGKIGYTNWSCSSYFCKS